MTNLFETDKITAQVTVADFINAVENSNFNYAIAEIESIIEEHSYTKDQTLPLVQLMADTESVFAYESVKEQQAFIKHIVSELQSE